ncbi:hypothetical protein BD410DRAFT_792275 [Rickenella mellea]|uniref:Uncharacterized protein n=1 Tax=Rickenella mellea TaxID=50990 RepID=A0A4Y7PW35_9AGAM|nr:hypothetical protein BD410DRAFT_792275 [Rickenella mellea]
MWIVDRGPMCHDDGDELGLGLKDYAPQRERTLRVGSQSRSQRKTERTKLDSRSPFGCVVCTSRCGQAPRGGTKEPGFAANQARKTLKLRLMTTTCKVTTMSSTTHYVNAMLTLC